MASLFQVDLRSSRNSAQKKLTTLLRPVRQLQIDAQLIFFLEPGHTCSQKCNRTRKTLLKFEFSKLQNESHRHRCQTFCRLLEKRSCRNRAKYSTLNCISSALGLWLAMAKTALATVMTNMASTMTTAMVTTMMMTTTTRMTTTATTLKQ